MFVDVGHVTAKVSDLTESLVVDCDCGVLLFIDFPLLYHGMKYGYYHFTLVYKNKIITNDYCADSQ